MPNQGPKTRLASLPELFKLSKYVQDDKTGTIWLRIPRLRGKALVKAAKRRRQARLKYVKLHSPRPNYLLWRSLPAAERDAR